MSKFFDSTINRVYKCTEKNCACEIVYEQKLFDDFKKICPFCNKESLVIEQANLSMSFIMDSKKPVTVGSIADKNAERRVKEGQSIEGFKNKKTPFWRKNKKRIDYSILKDPKTYIKTGSV
jgi:hypothetical protein